MFKPEPMSRVTLSGLRAQLPQLSRALARLRLVHLVEYQGDDDGFATGAPLGYGAAVSEQLVRVRSLLKLLDVQGAPPAAPRPTGQVEAELEAQLDDVEREALELRERLRVASRRLGEGRGRLELLERFAPSRWRWKPWAATRA